MKTYIGTKIIQAEPAFRIDGKIYSPDNILPKDTDVEEGYRVRRDRQSRSANRLPQHQSADGG